MSVEYCTAFNIALNGMVENQMRKAIANTANYWYTAWVNAGKPDLTELDAPQLTKRNETLLKQDYELWKKGKLFGVKSENEF